MKNVLHTDNRTQQTKSKNKFKKCKTNKEKMLANLGAFSFIFSITSLCRKFLLIHFNFACSVSSAELAAIFAS